MKKSTIITALSAALAIAASAESSESNEMEQCVVTKDGKNMIKAEQCDCATSKYSCAGNNPANDPEAWILVPKGECEKINKGDYSGIDQNTKNRIEGAS